MAVAAAQRGVAVDEELFGQGLGRPAQLQVLLSGPHRPLAQADDAVFEPLGALGPHPAAVEVEVGQAQIADLAGPKAAVQHEEEPGEVHPSGAPLAAVGGGGLGLDGGQQAAEEGDGEVAGEAVALLQGLQEQGALADGPADVVSWLQLRAAAPETLPDGGRGTGMGRLAARPAGVV